MTRVAFLFRFFHVVPPVPRAMHWAFAAAVGSGGLALALHAADAERVLAPILLLQTFAASSGFAVPARRGHYDLLFTSGVTRLWIGVGHLMASTWLGGACWMVMAMIEAVTHHGAPLILAANGTITTLLLISVLSWAITVPLPRLTGAIVWLTILAAPIDSRAIPALLRPLLMPWTLIGAELWSSNRSSLLLTAACVLVALAIAISWICRTDISLQVAR